MRFDFSFLRQSLKARLISNYLVILGIGGLATSIIGSWIVSSAIMMQARRSADLDLAVARMIYEHQIERLRGAVELASSGGTIQRYLASGDRSTLAEYLKTIRRTGGFDFLSLTNRNGDVVLRVSAPGEAGGNARSLDVVRAALAGSEAAGTDILSAEALAAENPALPGRARIKLVAAQGTTAPGATEQTSGMVQMAAAPIRDEHGGVAGALYGGVLLNRNFELVDRAWDLLFQGFRFAGQNVGTVAIFQNDVRISTNTQAEHSGRALGTRAATEVRSAVLERGQSWRDRAFVISDRYINAYEPIRNRSGQTVGILYAGLLEKAFTSIRDRVILSFFALATAGFILIIVVT
ncbi:MAG: cache domain-containing protein, partial [Bryobacteraceae bacterium]